MRAFWIILGVFATILVPVNIACGFAATPPFVAAIGAIVAGGTAVVSFVMASR